MDSTLLAVLSFGMGYAIGSLDSIRRSIRLSEKSSESSSFVSEVAREQKQLQSKRKTVSIDESTYVTDISTSDLESKGGSIGVISQTNDNIATAANKLAQLKKMKG